MRKTLAAILTALTPSLSLGLALSTPAEAGWKWKKMKWVPKPGQEYRSPYAHNRGYHYGQRYGYDRGYGYGRNYGRGYGYGRPYGPYGQGYGHGGFGPRYGW